MTDFLSLIQALKKEHGGKPLYATTVGEQVYIFRQLCDSEYALMLGMGQGTEEDVCRAAVIHPASVDWERAPAADAGTVCSQILTLSGFTDPMIPIGMLGQFRAEMETFRAKAEALIISAFPNKSLEEIEQWSVETLLRYLSRAEWILQNLRGYETNIELQVPEQTETDFAEQAEQARAQGIDPMLAYYRPPRRDANWVEIPFIEGAASWRTVVSRQKEE